MGTRYAKLFEAANPCSNDEILVLFEHGFYLNRPFVCMTLHEKALRP